MIVRFQERELSGERKIKTDIRSGQGQNTPVEFWLKTQKH